MNPYDQYLLDILEDEDFLLNIYRQNSNQNQLILDESSSTVKAKDGDPTEKVTNGKVVKRYKSRSIVKRYKLLNDECQYYENKNKELKNKIDDLQLQVNTTKDLIVQKLLHKQHIKS